MCAKQTSDKVSITVSSSGSDNSNDTDASDEGGRTATATQIELSQQEKIARNREKALMIRAAKRPLSQEPGAGCKIVPVKVSHTSEKAAGRVIDTGGGFLIEEPASGNQLPNTKVVHAPGAILDDDRTMCEDCDKEFIESYLLNKFDKYVCDNCKDMNSEKHKLITKTDAKTKYQLQDVDLDKREPLLRYIVKKNPRHEKWGEMKLYLESQCRCQEHRMMMQVLERAMEVYGSEEEMEKARLKKVERREKQQQKKFDKNVQALRMSVQATQPTKAHKSHKHEFGPEVYDEESDQYTKTCKTCSHSVTFEKM